MSILGRFFRPKNELSPGHSGFTNLGGNSAPLLASGHRSISGEMVSDETAMRFSAVWACVRMTAQTIASLPLAQFEKASPNSREIVEDDLSDILCIKPNSTQTKFEFWEGIVAQMLLRGNAYAHKRFIGNRLVALEPILDMEPRIKDDGSLEYRALRKGRVVIYSPDEVFHIRGFGAGGPLGLSAIKYGANSIGAALAAAKTASKIFANGMNPGGVLTSDQKLEERQREQLQSIMSRFAGSDQAGKMMVLEAGLKWSPVQINPEDAQLLETRKFSVPDVCMWFGVPPVVLGHSSEGQTMWGSGVEQILISWQTLGINPLLNRIQERIRIDLIPPAHRRRRKFEFNREAMLEMDSKAKGEFLMKMRFAGIMSGDEGRAKLNLPPRGGKNDELLVQTSLSPVDLLGKDAEK